MYLYTNLKFICFLVIYYILKMPKFLYYYYYCLFFIIIIDFYICRVYTFKKYLYIYMHKNKQY